MFKTFKQLLSDESGATVIEYALIAALVSVAAMAAMSQIGESLSTMYTSVSGTLSNAVQNATS